MPSISAWKSAEELVAAIEKSLAPNAIVEHDIRLPVVGQDRTRQCDVVIRIGKVPREQLIIVEVQKRHAKPDITTFHGWVGKMQEVGANGLICVSESGFPQSIIDDVRLRQGPKVKLMTLEKNDDPLSFGPAILLPELVKTRCVLKLVGMCPDFWEPPGRNILVERAGKILSNTGNPADAVTLDEALRQCGMEANPFSKAPAEAHDQTIGLTFNLLSSDELPLWLHTHQGNFRLRRMTLYAEGRQSHEVEPMTFMKWDYEQQFHGATVAWVATATIEIEGGVMIKKTLIFAPDEEGFLRLSLTLEPVTSSAA